MTVPETAPASHEIATLAAGCFWCVEAVFENVIGVDKVVSGYMGGTVDNPTYQQVCTGRTGHAEVIQVTFQPAITSYAEILEIFFAVHDPTTLNRQGADTGSQYRSAIFYHSPTQKAVAAGKIAELDAREIWPQPIVTQVVPAEKFYPAEDYHQGYFRNNPSNPYCAAVASPKVAKFRQHFAAKFKG